MYVRAPLGSLFPPKKCSSRPFVFLFYLIVRRAGFPTRPIMQPAAQTSVAIGGRGVGLSGSAKRAKLAVATPPIKASAEFRPHNANGFPPFGPGSCVVSIKSPELLDSRISSQAR